MTPYAGNPDSFPVTVDIPDDSDPPAAATFDVSYEGLADRTASLANGNFASALANIAALQAVNTTSLPNGAVRYVTGFGRYVLDTTVNPTFAQDLPVVVAPTTGPGRWYAQDSEAKLQYTKTFLVGISGWVCPPNMSNFDIAMCGGGGGGGGGIGADTTASDPPGGGGGAGARLAKANWTAIPLRTYEMIGGAGGAAGAAGAAGGDGAYSVIVDTFTVTNVLQALGGQGGSGATQNCADVGGGNMCIVPGGSAPSGSAKAPAFPLVGSLYMAWPTFEQGGGYSTNSQAANLTGGGATAGGNGPQGGMGGAVGARGAAVGRIGGGAGGGGGAGPFLGSNGGVGGTGGAGNSGGVGANGGAGNAPASGSAYGAGGGGGGGGGQGSTPGSTGGVGGAGMSGVITLQGKF